MDQADVRNIVLSGTDHVVASFRSWLPKRVDDCVIGTLNLDRSPARDRVVVATVRALGEAERAREKAIVRQVLDLKTSGSRVAVGLEDVLHALAHGRVHRLLLSERFDKSGFRCQACGKLGEQPPESCELCGEPVISCDLAEAMVVSAIRRGGEVDELVERPELDEMGGVAALLRY